MSEHKMNPELKAAWIKAMRDEPGKKIEHCLEIGDIQEDGSYECKGNCAMGVLASVAGLERQFSAHNQEPRRDITPRFEGTSYTTFMTSTLDELGLPVSAQTRIIQMNDDELLSFDDIADWVEKNIV